MTLITILTAIFKPIIVPILTALLGWLLPSPLQKAAKGPAEVADAQKKGNAGDPSDLDRP